MTVPRDRAGLQARWGRLQRSPDRPARRPPGYYLCGRAILFIELPQTAAWIEFRADRLPEGHDHPRLRAYTGHHVKLPLFAALLLLSSVSGICEAQVAGCGALQSQFLKDDPTAQAIASGVLANYSMDDFALRLGMPWPGASTDVFAYRLLSAIRALGYLPGVWTFGGENPGLELLNKFQRLNGLAESSTITAASLLAIDAALARQEMREREIAPISLSFRC